MAANSDIEWTHHTFNPWTGCTKISPACDRCYAASMASRFRRADWGPQARRVPAREPSWQQPVKWNRDAELASERRRVFCLSMGDLFEKRRELDPLRARLWPLIEATTSLDWLLLTKRPANVTGMAPWGTTWPANVWLGTTVENQKWARRRLPFLLQMPAAVRIVSCEPLLEPVDLTGYLARDGRPGIDWVIAGGESGAGARPSDPSWMRSLRDQCAEAGVPFFFKQWGAWSPESSGGLLKLGKKRSGRHLDGRTWDEFPLAAGPVVVRVPSSRSEVPPA